jgi:hypothetical protein
MMFVPRRIFEVVDPHHASGDTASLPQLSAVNTESYPSASTILMVSGTFWGIDLPQ